jgi:polyisoprenoid-binding protein YceI
VQISRRMFPRKPAVFAAMCLSLASVAGAEQVHVTLDPLQTKVEWTLGATLHKVHGTFKLKSGQISFDTVSGNASGEFVLDATSGTSGNDTRDRKMHQEVLESKRYPEITFLPKKVSGHLADQGDSNVQVQGVFHIHGADHDLAVSVPVIVSGHQVRATTSFEVPYQAWGMKNPSSVFLHVDDKVQIRIAVAGRINSASAHCPGY